MQLNFVLFLEQQWRLVLCSCVFLESSSLFNRNGSKTKVGALALGHFHIMVALLINTSVLLCHINTILLGRNQGLCSLFDDSHWVGLVMAPSCHFIYITTTLNPVLWSCWWCKRFSAWDVATFLLSVCMYLCTPLCGSCQQGPHPSDESHPQRVLTFGRVGGVACCSLKSEADCVWKIISDNHRISSGLSLELYKVSLTSLHGR